MTQETLEHRERRLALLAETIEGALEAGWLFVCVIGKPGDMDSCNLVSNATPDQIERIITMFETLMKRQAQGERPKPLDSLE